MIDKIEEFCLKILEKMHFKKLSEWYRKHKEAMRYLIFGGLTTLVNIITYAIFYYILHVSNAWSNVIAWVIAATFAYITNKLYVFDAKTNGAKELFREMIYFYVCRLATLAIDEGIMILTVDKWGWNAIIMKVIANVIVIILNFILSKIIIFKKK